MTTEIPTDRDPMFSLFELLPDAAAALEHFGMRGLAGAVHVARRRLADLGHYLRNQPEPKESAPRNEVITGRRVDERNDGNRAWWGLPSEQRDLVLAALLRLRTEAAAPDPAEHLAPGPTDADLVEAYRAALELLTPDWRTSLLTQIATLRPSVADTDPEADQALARAQEALELRSDSPPAEPFGPLHRPVFYADAVKGKPLPFALGEDCGVCSAPAGTYCDPTKHPEVPGEG